MWHKIILAGNLGADAKMKRTPSGQAVTSFSVGTSRSWKGKDGEWMKETVWFRCEAWGKVAEVCANLEKGAKVLVEGRLKPDLGTGAPRVWQNKNGEAKASFEVTIGEIKFLDKKKETAQVEEDAPF